MDELVMALYENGEAIYADIKDDETIETVAGQLLDARGIGEWIGGKVLA